ncbi:MAG: NAD-dependent epimerase/dehydratase family protein [Gomphosphaeria aponina SAG 52.96 = DSM 107014]|uniref:NAD-dependent epimerase/dehydratase family protein n=1 Tax=Gomphosphaeria aponina SAG 52.96 = DSM 107014 TaxID=1521640 RepID=A0A941JP14_9CHRO|nr:NAD-dependent epimerase/dehydratase family protein [Gomphosphaeria aponina SAG 52.96 = DSM 107014]
MELNQKNQSSLLVTGATGFIASHLLPILQQQGWEITAAVRNNFSQITTRPMKIIKIGEIDGKTNWKKALQGINIVIHLAARAHILAEEIPNPEAEFMRVNTEGTANLVKQSIEAGVKQFIFISSIGAMASFSEKILTENESCQPDSPYGVSKLKAETALIQQAKNSKMSWTIFRPTLVYGPGNPGNMERLMKLVKLGLPLPFGGIKNRRSLIYVENLVQAIAHSLNHPQAANQTFLLRDSQDISTPELILKIAQKMQKPCQLLPLPPNILKLLGDLGDIGEKLSQKNLPLNSYTINRLLGSLFVDSSHIQNTLKWYPPFTIDYGIEKTIQP